MSQFRLVAQGSSAMLEEPHRYLLSRWWGDGPRVLWVMLNPSTADDRDDDHTIRKCVGFAKRWGFDGIDVVNLFSWISTDWRGVVDNLADAADTRTDAVIREVAAAAPFAVLGWGRYASRSWIKERAEHVVGTLYFCGVRLQCLGTNRDGSPRHPLTLGYDTPREDYES